ncbi:WD40-repeat-containing domain protein [Scenedesmus sp. NREL 46B-D3]|nr:WD40-repeat-containing domain protein [Scenedesmus sp. NREL 46B-D3]
MAYPGDEGANFQDEELVFSADLFSASLSSQQRSDLAQQKYTPQPEAEPLNFLLKAVKDGEQMQPGRVVQFGPEQEATCVSVARDASVAAVGCRLGQVLIVDPSSQQVLDSLPLQEVPAAVVTCVRFRLPTAAGGAANRSMLLVAKGSKLLHVHTGTRSVVAQSDEGSSKINNIRIRADGQLVATAGSDMVVRVYDDQQRAPLLRLSGGDGKDCCGHSNTVFGLAWKPEDCQVLLSAGWDATVQVWDLRVGHAVRSMAGGSWVCGDGLDVQGSKVLTGSWRDKQPLQLWDYGSGRLLTNLPFHQPQQDACMPYAARFGPPGCAAEGLLAAGGSGKQPVLRLYNKKGHLLSTLHTASAVHALDWVNQGQQQQQQQLSGDLLAVCCARQLHFLTSASGKPR